MLASIARRETAAPLAIAIDRSKERAVRCVATAWYACRSDRQDRRPPRSTRALISRSVTRASSYTAIIRSKGLVDMDPMGKAPWPVPRLVGRMTIHRADEGRRIDDQETVVKAPAVKI